MSTLFHFTNLSIFRFCCKCFVIAALFVALTGTQVLAQERPPRPANRIVVLLDRSGSFIKHLPQAKDLARKYIREIGNSSPNDEIYVVGIDNHTSQITYIRGVRSRRAAKVEFDNAFTQTTNGRGTDFITGFRIASKDFSLSPKPGASHLLVFGDLACDDETDLTTGAVIRDFKDLADFDWSVFRGVNVSMWFVNDKKRDTLNAIPGFASLGATVNTIESEARAGDLRAPRPVRTTEQNSDSGSNSMFIYGLWAFVLIAGMIFLSRRPAGTR